MPDDAFFGGEGRNDPRAAAAFSDESRGASAPRCTDAANADAIVVEQGGDFCYVPEWGKWIAWDGRRWVRVGARQRVFAAAIQIARNEHSRCASRIAVLDEKIRVAALKGQKDEDSEARLKIEQRLLKWHEQSQNASKVEAAMKVLEARLIVQLNTLNRNPMLLNVANGTIDLRTAELMPHRREDLITQLADVEWSDGAKCPTWDAFVLHAMGGDRTLVCYLQRLIGYSITGLTTEHVLAFFHGGGRNGKSTFLQAVRTMLGEYACPAPRGLLFEDKSQRHPTEMAGLHEKRFVVGAEIGEFVTLDEAKVKDLTGGDAISVRRMNEDFWDLIPTHTLFIGGNHKPVIKGNDLGIWRRVRLIPWLVQIDEADVDKALPEKLRAELPGILRWAVLGCVDWQEQGLQEPETVKAATQEYRDESDTLGQFFEERCNFGDGHTCARADLRLQYEQWCTEAGHKPVGAKKIAARLREKGVTAGLEYSTGKTRDGWKGVGLKRETERPLHRASYSWGTEN